MNDGIRAREVRVVDQENEQLGIMSLRDALRLAEERNLDLVNVAPNAKPPVCRIMDFGKFKYEQSKKEKESRKNQKVVLLKEVRMTPNIDEHDFNVKLKNVLKFLKDGSKVKVSVRFRGREITHQSIGQELLIRLAKQAEEQAIVERMPRLEGRHMVLILSPKQPSA
ncbi:MULTISPECIES: translation initiation factor IF-3 [Alicyclobacillus]|uniref:translation initiation factor IF-3 n=1 Tax=Alicyclobacillus TaxID=29330 RepID=UPI000385F2FB|nr:MULTISPECIES: translation initiation factor IF-3 [Alicyclobacillus]EPZ53093.1 translation initiation factor IF-3 [Alicyclobacillus acidoterrestris ATCC 49025]GEO24284.1 translation initiation factor IF-3 [Alicyclobacillus acidoterrestris]GMA59767.1 translation initiation factor IF-3 [Alicyclobacillus fastidiosus]